MSKRWGTIPEKILYKVDLWLILRKKLLSSTIYNRTYSRDPVEYQQLMDFKDRGLIILNHKLRASRWKVEQENVSTVQSRPIAHPVLKS